MGFWAVAGPIIASIASSYLSNKSSRTGDQSGLANRVGNAQGDRVEQGTRLRSDIEGMIREMGQGGAPPAFRLGTTPGSGTDIEEFLGQIQSNAELNKLMELLAAGEGNVGTANQALGASLSQDNSRKKDIQDLALSLLMAYGSSGGGGSGIQSSASGFGNGSTFGNGAVIGNG